MLRLLSIAFLASSLSFASTGLVIHGSEIVTAKFHRMDNKIHPYTAPHAWVNYVPPDSMKTTPLIQNNQDGSVTVFFSTFEELVKSMIEVSQKSGKKVTEFNIESHGLPGGMWFPIDEAQRASFDCMQWNDLANGDDKGAYDGYYSAVSKDEIDQFRSISQNGGNFPCTIGVNEWQTIVQRNPAFPGIFDANATFHSFGCLVGLGPVGESYVAAIDKAMFGTNQGSLVANTNFGLGDWSMAEGAGFWDYQNDQQLDHDNQIYVQDKKDREIMQKGTIRITHYDGTTYQTELLGNQDFMRFLLPSWMDGFTKVASPEKVPYVHVTSVRVPRTNAVIPVY